MTNTEDTEKYELPMEITIGERTYEVVNILKEGETSISGHELVKRVKMFNTRWYRFYLWLSGIRDKTLRSLRLRSK